MPTRPQPVPWPEVIDLQGDLFEWLDKRGHVTAKDGPHQTAWKVLARYPDPQSPEHRIAVALVDLELYRGADRRSELLRDGAKRAQAEVDPVDWALAHDDSPELEADGALRGVQHRLSYIRRKVEETKERDIQRQERSDFLPDVKARSIANIEAKYASWNERLELVMAATAELHEEFLALCPSVPQRPLTLSGWRAFKKHLQESLADLNIEWS